MNGIGQPCCVCLLPPCKTFSRSVLVFSASAAGSTSLSSVLCAIRTTCPPAEGRRAVSGRAVMEKVTTDMRMLVFLLTYALVFLRQTLNLELISTKQDWFLILGPWFAATGSLWITGSSPGKAGSCVRSRGPTRPRGDGLGLERFLSGTGRPRARATLSLGRSQRRSRCGPRRPAWRVCLAASPPQRAQGLLVRPWASVRGAAHHERGRPSPRLREQSASHPALRRVLFPPATSPPGRGGRKRSTPSAP